MEKITMKEYKALDLARPGASEEFLKVLQSCKVDEGLLIQRKDWMLNTMPSDYVAQFGAKTGKQFKCRVLRDRSGWAVMRVK